MSKQEPHAQSRRWSSPSGKNYAYTTKNGRGLLIKIGKCTNYYFSRDWPVKKKGKK